MAAATPDAVVVPLAADAAAPCLDAVRLGAAVAPLGLDSASLGTDVAPLAAGAAGSVGGAVPLGAAVAPLAAGVVAPLRAPPHRAGLKMNFATRHRLELFCRVLTPLRRRRATHRPTRSTTRLPTKGTHNGSNPSRVIKLTTEAAARRNRRGETAPRSTRTHSYAVNRPHRFRAELIASPPACALIRVTRAASSVRPPSAGARPA